MYIPNITFVTAEWQKLKNTKNTVKLKKLLLEPRLVRINLGLHVRFGILCLLNYSLSPGRP